MGIAIKCAKLFAICTLVYLLLLTAGCSSLGCYVCSSSNGSEPFCEDPFNTTYPNTTTVDFYKQECMAGRKNRDGVFPSSVCVKVKGTYVDSDGETLLIRTCALDSATLTIDTEISRLDHSCGVFDFVAEASDDGGDATATSGDGRSKETARRLSGCIDVCNSADGCNGADGRRSAGDSGRMMIMMVMSIVMLIVMH